MEELRNGSIHYLEGTTVTQEQIAQKFLKKYFPSTKTTKLRNDISTFMQSNK